MRGLFAGMANIDFTYVVEEIPPRNAKIAVGNPLLTTGGPAANAAVTFAFLGGKAELATVLGQHPLAAVMHEDLRAAGVEVRDVAPERQTAPPVSAVLVIRGTGERTVIASGDKSFPSPQFACDPRWFQDLTIVLVDGLYMPVCVAVAAGAHARGIPVVLDGGSWKPGLPDLLPHVDLAVCSQDFRPPHCHDAQEVFDFLQAQGIARAAITRGEQPVIYADGGGRGEIAVPQVRAVDTTGAGDIFHGAFCWYAAQGKNFRDALAAAARVAAFSCQYLGARSWREYYSSQESGVRS
jgi:sugar/nucleoside kinase (ribokinase family)